MWRAGRSRICKTAAGISIIGAIRLGWLTKPPRCTGVRQPCFARSLDCIGCSRSETYLHILKNKVLIIVENLPVPLDSRVWKEAVSLQANGYEVAVLCPRGKGYMQGHELLEGIDIYRHPMPREANSPIGYV